jgi:hypothetical protein
MSGNQQQWARGANKRRFVRPCTEISGNQWKSVEISVINGMFRQIMHAQHIHSLI